MVEQESGKRINRIEDDAEVDSREMKHPAQVARLALLMQVLRYASGESHLQFVDLASVKAAIRLNGYFEDSYRRIRSFVAEDMCEDPPKVLLSLCRTRSTRRRPSPQARNSRMSASAR